MSPDQWVPIQGKEGNEEGRKEKRGRGREGRKQRSLAGTVCHQISGYQFREKKVRGRGRRGREGRSNGHWRG